jgi:hypothetical protein
MIFSLMPAAEEPKPGICAEVLARSYSSLPFALLKRAIWPLPSDQLRDFAQRKNKKLSVSKSCPLRPTKLTTVRVTPLR